MPSPTGVPQGDLPPLETGLWLDLIASRCCLFFSEGRLRVLSQALRQRMGQLGFRSLVDYYDFVAFRPEGQAEWPELLNLLLNHETCFFRHTPSFEALKGHVLPQLVSEGRPPDAPLRLWSAGCSTGQEPYSLAIAFLDTVGRQGGQVQVSASDISPRALERARLGRYRPFEVRSLPEDNRARYLHRLDEEHGPVYQVCDAVRELVRFDGFNLNDPDSYGVGSQDAIFCQNVLIYFAPEARAEIVGHLAERLNPGGYLFLGPAEAMGLRAAGLEPVRLESALIYRRPPTSEIVNARQPASTATRPRAWITTGIFNGQTS
jgi:chemotaxis methyl-accepting protein methylase